jgi:hypothetical protein
MKETLHYIGDFKALIPNGWTFHKLFANNYRCYFYPANGEFGDHVVIWQSKRYVNFPNMFEEDTAALMRFFLAGITFEPYSEIVKQKLGFTGLSCVKLVYDMNENIFRLATRDDDIIYYMSETRETNRTDAELDQWDRDHSHLRNYTIPPEFYDLALKWYNDGMFEFRG